MNPPTQPTVEEVADVVRALDDAMGPIYYSLNYLLTSTMIGDERFVPAENYAAQSLEIQAVREALLSAYRHMQSTGAHESYLTTQRKLLEAGGYKFDALGYYIDAALKQSRGA